MSNKYKKSLLVCSGSSCQKTMNIDLVQHINGKLKEYNLDQEINAILSVCINKCSIGPNIIVFPDNVEYSTVTKDDIDDIIIEHLLKNRIVDRLVYNEINEISGT